MRYLHRDAGFSVDCGLRAVLVLGLVSFSCILLVFFSGDGLSDNLVVSAAKWIVVFLIPVQIGLIVMSLRLASSCRGDVSHNPVAIPSKAGLKKIVKLSVDKLRDERPWGHFERFCHNEPATVKILHAKKGQELSLQYHHHRDEFWKILSGRAEVIIGDKAFKAKQGDEFFISRGRTHRLKTGRQEVSWLEISFGYFDEKDEVRLEDRYKRISPDKPKDFRP